MQSMSVVLGDWSYFYLFGVQRGFEHDQLTICSCIPRCQFLREDILASALKRVV